MITPEPSQAYIEALAQSIRAADELDYDQLVKLLFAIIDQFCAQIEASTQTRASKRVFRQYHFEDRYADALDRQTGRNRNSA